MWIRAAIAVLVLGFAPLSAWAGSLCCGETETCCEGVLPDCPVLPDGQCAIVASGHQAATVHTGPDLAQPDERAPAAVDALVFAVASPPDLSPSRAPGFTLLTPLRN